MNITIFNRKYWVRRFGEQVNVKGFLKTTHKDIVVSMHVHPVGANTMQALPEGERMVKRLEGHNCDTEIFASNQDSGRKGDLLFYGGAWYECVSAVLWDHTILSHWNYQFTLVPLDSANSIDLSAPVGEPI